MLKGMYVCIQTHTYTHTSTTLTPPFGVTLHLQCEQTHQQVTGRLPAHTHS